MWRSGSACFALNLIKNRQGASVFVERLKSLDCLLTSVLGGRLPLVGRKKAPLGEEQLQRLVDACEDVFETQTILLLAHTGMHVSVLPQLSTANLVRRSGSLKLEWTRPKTGRQISVPVTSELKPWIEDYLSLPCPPRYASDDYYYKLVKRVAARAGLHHVSPMSFRHTAGYELFKQGGPSAPKKILGVSERVIATYASLDDHAIDREAERILGGLGKATKKWKDGSTNG